MFRRILIPVDLTKKNARAIKFSAGLGSPERLEVTLLHVIELIQGASFNELKSFYRKLETNAQREMKLLMADESGWTPRALRASPSFDL